MQVTRAASIPLITHDPYFSIWCPHDSLNGGDPRHWCGQRQKLRGYVHAGKETYCFLGDPECHKTIGQTGLDVTATSTTYTFENDALWLQVRFTSPLLLDDMVLVSRPCTYVDFTARAKNGQTVTVDFVVSDDLVVREKRRLNGKTLKTDTYSYAFMGAYVQTPLGHSGDKVTIDWGYAYLASDNAGAKIIYDEANGQLVASLPVENGEASLIAAYDDLLAVNYMGQWRRAYWTQVYPTIRDAMAAAFADKTGTLARCAALDKKLEAAARSSGGEDYAFLCVMSYRLAVAAHKLITDEEGSILFLSKENDSGGCVGTVDVSYPSMPLFLLFDTEYVKGMLRPIFRFAACDVWEYDFAPHDMGMYPYAWGQIYGADDFQDAGVKLPDYRTNGLVYPPYYQYPAGSNPFRLEYQMPVEECGNMLIMTAAVCIRDGNGEFAKPYMDQLKQWVQYLLKYGADPGDQLCTDDFAGRLSHNVNLAVKAILGIESYSRLLGMLGDAAGAEEYHARAKEMAADWERRAFAGDHYRLVFDDPDTWSLKYNMVWDKLFGSGLFSDTVYETEYAYYLKKANEFGTPLDNRRDFTKSDWILWCAAMAGSPEKAEKLISPVAEYLRRTESRVPFSDWYDTVTANYHQFIGRSVQGGIFMPILMTAGLK